MTPVIRIVKVRYRSGINGRVAVAFAKVPYSGLFDLNEKLARLLATGEIRWFRVEAASPTEIARERDRLARWPDALRATVDLTRINLEA